MRGLALLLIFVPSLVLGEELTREQKVKNDHERVTSTGYWIYNDLPKGFLTARATGKPMVVVFRCIPCEECVKLDDDLVETDPTLQPLLEQFVRVRQVSTNGLDLNQFRFDTDQSFAVVMLNADGTVYGRYGTRSHRTEWEDDVSIPGLARALEGALELHKNYPNNKDALAGKQAEPEKNKTPESFPLHQGKSAQVDFLTGNVVKNCIHCHQISEARLDLFRRDNQPIPMEVLYPYPHPKAIGLILDPTTQAHVEEVNDDSLAAAAGFQPGDDVQSLNGQPILSMADVQWVLNSIPDEGGEVTATVKRGDSEEKLNLQLPEGWRQLDDISWRVSSWTLRMMSAGGLVTQPLSSDERARLKIPEGKMALKVEHVGQYNKHAAGKRAGFQQGDVIVQYGGRDDLMRESDMLVHGVRQLNVGDRVPVTVLRGGKRVKLELPIQKM